ncbi:Multimodular transpeptidase-transglycosylase [Fulvivirga imtechensis AK7]|uniref:Multimodular transpeptidase-transglycosylase n=1 Tax=Fulvivirga imtechensis AK7 TaxID=1237149 RepID=L8JRB6_9BACT|nr:transglycosylase domain-containing protein [Fulvivirga imtechensis]ELR69892.1 Multimodular transpeptidase-transglycosylase [Fulvivirga imtechensis AK7]
MDFKNFFNKQRKVFKILVIAIWIFLLGGVFLGGIYIWSVQTDFMGLYGGMPSLKALENPENDLSSELLSADGVSLGRYFRYNRSQVTYDELSEDLVNTLLLSEDHRYFDHSGMDFVAYLRVIKGILTLNYAGGGSTITQQLAKNLYTQDEELEGKIASLGGYPKRIVEKTKEWIISVYLERNFTKKEILAMYLNTAEFGSNAYGIKTAAETFFNKQPGELNLQESAVLVGLLQAVTFFNPVRNYENSIAKRNEVLYKVYKHGYKINTRQEYDSIAALPIELDYDVANQNKGLATYFRSVIRNDLMAWCRENGYDLWEDGLKIYTTIDSRMQRYAEEAMKEHMAELQKLFDEHWNGKNPWIDEKGREIPNFLNDRFKRTDHYRALVEKYGEGSDSIKIMMNMPHEMTVFTWNGEKDTVMSPMDSLNYYKRFLQAGLMSMEPHTGHIKAWVGGVDHKFFKYDHVKQGKRQPGSTFKAFVYGAAIEQGYPPCYEVVDIAITIPVPGGTWTAPNADGTYGTGDKMTIRQGMARSVNTITAYLMNQVKPQNVVDFAHRVGIESHLDAVPALALGVSDVSVYELVGAYSTFANQGIYTKPYYITKIEDKNGNIIENFVPKTRQAISQQTAYKMLYMLKGGVEERGGTSAGIDMELKIDNEIGGKTGTTNNASDGWYMGITKDLVTGVWVGGDERSIHFRNWYLGQGAKTARPIWEKYMLKVYKNQELGYTKGTFQRPVGGIDVNLDCSRYNTVESDSTVIEEEPAWNPNDFQ